MIAAEMNNKIPKLETWEDVLTSNVFGLLELIEYKYLVDLLAMAENHNNDNLTNILKDKKIQTVELWKNFKKIGEPDILVYLEDRTFFIIEVKYFGVEHNEKNKQFEDYNIDNKEEYKENGQLAKYLDIEIDKQKSNFIIYLTADYQSIKQIKESESSSKKYLNNIYHIHWEQFNEYLKKIEKIEKIEGIEKNIVSKIVEYLNYKGFDYWEGFKYQEEYRNIQINTEGFYENK